MSENENNTPPRPTQATCPVCGASDEDEISLLDYAIVLAKRKWLIIGITFSFALITAIYSLFLPNIYQATTTILPPQQGSSSLASQVLGQFGGIAGLAGSSMGLKNPNDLYLGMLKSRTVYDRIIDRFALMKLYEAKYRDDARRHLAGSLEARCGKDGIISISVENRDPNLAANMANAFVEELKRLTQTLAVTEAAQRRLFFDEQLRLARGNLIDAEEGMQRFQEKTGAIKVDDQAKAVIEGIARLRAEIAAKQVQLKVMRTYTTAANPDLQRVEEELKGLKAESAKIEARGGSNPDPLMPTGRMPSVGRDYVRKMRDLKYNETLYELLAKQYEMAKLDEARDTAIIQLLDKATPPEKKAKPKRLLMVILATCAGSFFSVFAAFFTEYLERSSHNPESKERLETLKKYGRIQLRKERKTGMT